MLSSRSQSPPAMITLQRPARPIGDRTIARRRIEPQKAGWIRRKGAGAFAHAAQALAASNGVGHGRDIDTHDFMTLAPARVSGIAMLMSSVVFAAGHREVAAGVLAGVVFAWLYRRHGDLRLAIMAPCRGQCVAGSVRVDDGALRVLVMPVRSSVDR